MKTAASSSLQRGKRIPNWVVKDLEGKRHTLWDYRQKSHLILIYDPESKPERVQQWKSAIAADRKQWDWLNVTILLVEGAPREMEPGVYAIDRYGIFLNSYPSGNWKFDDLEREFLYYEAYHC